MNIHLHPYTIQGHHLYIIQDLHPSTILCIIQSHHPFIIQAIRLCIHIIRDHLRFITPVSQAAIYITILNILST